MKIPQPTENDMSPAELAQHRADLAKLEADPRTRGSNNRPPWLVRRVLEGK